MTRGWVKPEYTPSKVTAAGRRIREARPTHEDWEVLENWRRSHAYVLNTFQMRLRSARTRFASHVQIAQRHKRLATIVDKLRREPTMQLRYMHDIAGCRAILPSIPVLKRFREMFLSTRAAHVHSNAGSDRFDYIKAPKPSGYRGIHDVFEVRLGSESGSAWNGLKVEVQFRTRVQHAWATAVETLDLLNGDRAKFGEASPALQRFFVLASELLSRHHENRAGFLADAPDREVATEFIEINNDLRVLERLRSAASTAPAVSKGLNTILIFHFGDFRPLEIKQFYTITTAQAAYTKLENDLHGIADVVLVKAEHSDDLRKAFQNYFTDSTDFLRLVMSASTALARPATVSAKGAKHSASKGRKSPSNKGSN